MNRNSHILCLSCSTVVELEVCMSLKLILTEHISAPLWNFIPYSKTAVSISRSWSLLAFEPFSSRDGVYDSALSIFSSSKEGLPDWKHPGRTLM